MRRMVALSIVTVVLLALTAVTLAWEGIAQVRSVSGAPHNIDDEDGYLVGTMAPSPADVAAPGAAGGIRGGMSNR